VNIWDIIKILFWIIVISGTVYYFTKSVKRLFQVAGGLALFEAYNNLFDIGLWPAIQGWFGGYGALGLTVMALILNFIMLKWYQRCKVDWLGITVTDEVLKKGFALRMAYGLSSGKEKLKLAPQVGIYWIIEKAITVRLIPFLVLSIFGDSFIATAFLLHRKNGHKDVALEREDYVVFLLSTIFSCLVWTLFTEWAILPAFKNMWQTLF
jgi:hypothetical protein